MIIINLIYAEEHMIIVSACLLGINCKYDGKNSMNKSVMEKLQGEMIIPVCPEQLGGFPTPRPAVEISGGTGADVLDGRCRCIRENGEDVTEGFIKGAHEVLKIARLTGARKAVLKSRSPSCGFGEIYDGTFSGERIDGNGVTAELLHRNGIEVISSD